MNLSVLDKQRDGVIKSLYLTVSTTYTDAVDYIVPLIDKLDYQRGTLRRSFYERLEQDLLKGCIMPNLTLAIYVDGDLPNEDDINELFLTDHICDAFVLDGIQRLNTLNRIKDNPDFPGENKLYCNVLISNSMDRLLYRMITLNNGQKPMTARHQVEILAGNIFDFDNLPILAVTEKQAKKKKKPEDSMNKDVLIKGYLAYISNSINIDNQKIIEAKMDELIAEQVLASNIDEKEGEYRDVIAYVNRCIEDEELKDWFMVPNNFIGFCAAMNKSFKVLCDIPPSELKESISLFELAFNARSNSPNSSLTAIRKA